MPLRIWMFFCVLSGIGRFGLTQNLEIFCDTNRFEKKHYEDSLTYYQLKFA